MASIATTGVTLSSDFYLSKFYKDNRSARKSSGRLELSDSELSYEDARALRRAVKQRESKQVMDRIRNNDLQTEFLLKVGKCLRIPLFMQEQEHIPLIQKGM